MLARAKRIIRTAISLALTVFPSGIKRHLYRWMFGYKIGRHVKIGVSWINVGALEIGDYVTIGHLTRFKNIPSVQIGDHTTIGVGNTFTSTAEFTRAEAIALHGNEPVLAIGRHCGIAMFHYFDVQDKVVIGEFTTIAGRGSVFFTHYLDVTLGVQACKPVQIGRYCMIGSNALFAPGASIADCSVVGMGAVVTKPWRDPRMLLGGNPARAIRQLPADAAYFHRQVGWIGEFTP